MNRSATRAVIVLAVIVIVIMGWLSQNFALTISLSYIALLVRLQFLNLGKVLLVPELQTVWDSRAHVVRTYVFDPCKFETPKFVDASPHVILDDANLFNMAKLKYLLSDTQSFAVKTTNNLRIVLFGNILLLLALIIAISQGTEAASTAAASTPAVAAISASKDTLRHLLSYTAVALQLSSIILILFHYRQKNAEACAQSGAGPVPAPAAQAPASAPPATGP